MKGDGIFDPSDFIDDHRDIFPLIGNGSIISYHAKQRPLVSLDLQYPFGITQDITQSHTQYKQQSGYFQWQASSVCKALEISFPDQNYSANITVGHWSNRENDLTFKNVTLPFVLGESNMLTSFNEDGHDWYVISVGLKPRVSLSTFTSEQLSATCVDAPPTLNNGIISKGDLVLIGEHQWNGNASIISRSFEKYPNPVLQTNLPGNWPFGVYIDVTKIHKSQYKPVVFFQWMSSESCKKITIDVPGLTNKDVSIGTKNWRGKEYVKFPTTLPVTLTSSRLWTVIEVAFNNPVDDTYSVYATCE